MSSPSATAPSPNSPEQCIPQNNYGNFDLSSVFHVQNDYLFDVTTSTANADNAPEIVSYVSDVQHKLGNLSNKFQDANSSSQAVLAHQQLGWLMQHQDFLPPQWILLQVQRLE